MKLLLKQTKNALKLRGYSSKTRRAYILYIKQYLAFSKRYGLKNSKQTVEKFLLRRVDKNQSPQTINLALNSIKFFYREILKSYENIDFKYLKRSKKLPIVLSRFQIERILQHTDNAKYRIMISLGYACGLRISEVTNLKVLDLDIDELTVHIKEAKCKKDRISVLPEKLTNDLRNIIAGKNQNEYLFSSNRGGKLTTASLQKVFRQSLKKSGIKKPATFHSLRHSFATHLLENGIDIRYVQELLGHANIRTTQIYTKVTNPKLKNIKSPL